MTSLFDENKLVVISNPLIDSDIYEQANEKLEDDDFNNNVILGLCGGVDSSVAAVLLQPSSSCRNNMYVAITGMAFVSIHPLSCFRLVHLQ